MRTHELKCFGATPSEGNPALVIEDGPASQLERAVLARSRNMTCVFIDPSPAPDVAATLDYYYPHTRSPLCLHATLAAARVLLADEPLTVATDMQGQRLVLSRDGDNFFVRLDAQAVPQLAALPDLAVLLGIPGFIPASSPCVASVGSPKLLVQVASDEMLYSLKPDLQAITAWGKQHGVSGIYAWCLRPDGRYEGRNFNHLDPALEDSATGVAAGALTVLLGHGIELLQGHATGSACLIRTAIDGHAVLVGGAAEPA